jgi:hypothetical protein
MILYLASAKWLRLKRERYMDFSQKNNITSVVKVSVLLAQRCS